MLPTLSKKLGSTLSFCASIWNSRQTLVNRNGGHTFSKQGQRPRRVSSPSGYHPCLCWSRRRCANILGTGCHRTWLPSVAPSGGRRRSFLPGCYAWPLGDHASREWSQGRRYIHAHAQLHWWYVFFQLFISYLTHTNISYHRAPHRHPNPYHHRCRHGHRDPLRRRGRRRMESRSR